jgi:putative endonuclease
MISKVYSSCILGIDAYEDKTMGRERKDIGAAGEKIASVYLRKMGYKILKANFRTPFGEIDIVARHKGIMVFVEIKSRLTSSLGPPYLSITRAKERHIIKNALFYLKSHRLTNVNWRVDIVSIKLSYECKLESIELIENAVEDSYV